MIENVRLRELIEIVDGNKRFFDDFLRFLAARGYATIHAFVNDADSDRAVSTLREYLTTPTNERLFDGLGRPYDAGKAKWYFLAWLFRDAPAQRLGPLLRRVPGKSVLDRQAILLNEIRKFVAPLFPTEAEWTWPAIREVMLARLEGSRRALRGGLAEEVVRFELRALLDRHGLQLQVGEAQLRLEDETYDVQLIAGKRQILFPVKTRETMGGGHSNLFTRDIFKAITAARKAGFECIPVIIAESWSADLESLGCKNIIHIDCNPNEAEIVAHRLRDELEKLVSAFREFCSS